MKTMKKVLSIIALLALTLSAAFAQEPVKKYELKSGIIKNVSNALGQEIETQLFFDDYGALETTKTRTEVPGKGMLEITTISRDGKTYMINPMMKPALQEIDMKMDENVNYLNLTDAAKEKFKIEDLGTEMIGERECTKYSQIVDQSGIKAKATIWVWKGIPIKTSIKIMGMEMTTEAVEIQENAYILPITFEVPTE